MLNEYAYIEKTGLTGNTAEDVYLLLKVNGKDKTLSHSMAVADTCGLIADRFKLDKHICMLSGCIHDISVLISPDDMLNYAKRYMMYVDEAEKRYPFLLHQRISRIITENDFGITDKRVLSAVGHHTTLNANPTAYDMILFVADKLSWDQHGVPPYYDIVTGELEKSLEFPSLAYMNYIVENRMILYPHKWFIEGKAFLEAVISQ